jgi:hypothetical protein
MSILSPRHLTHLTGLTAAVALLCTTAATAQAEYHFAIDENGPPISWELDLNLGPIDETPPNITFAGMLVLELDSATAPFSTGQLHASLIRSVPTTIVGVIPNPVPVLPALGSFTISALQASIHTSQFTIAPNGDFTADVTMRTSAGTAALTGIFGSSTLPLAGMYQIFPSVPLSGNISQMGSTLTLDIDLDVTLLNITPGGSITGSISLNGQINALASTTSVDPMTVVVPHPVFAGQTHPITVRNAVPSLNTFLAVSTSGLGSFFAAPLGVIVDLNQPFQAGPPVAADPNGTALWTANIPVSTLGYTLWFQGLQIGHTSNVLGTWVE